MHSGGMLMPDEVPIIAQRGEKILSRSQVANGGGGSNITVNHHWNISTSDAHSFRKTQAQLQADAARQSQRLLRS